jgi:predicted amidohydrolase YtcJ
VARVAQAAREAPAGSWIRGRSWDHTRWAGARYPSRSTLDAAAGDRPVVLLRVDGHSRWVSSAVLARAGLSRDSGAPAGGALLRDAAGELTGVLVDRAMDPVVAVMPPPSGAELEHDLLAGASSLAAAGLTGVHDMGLTPAMLEALDALVAAGRLPVRVTGYLFGGEAELAPLLARGPRAVGLVRVPGIKLLLDGALGSHGAALCEPYADAPATRGLLLHDPEELARWAEHAGARGFQLALHAIGDRASEVALALVADARARAEAHGHPRRRHRIEHAQVVPARLLRRYLELEVVASVQPVHAVDDRDFAGVRLGPARLLQAYPLARLLAAGVPVALGSDAPIASHDPWRGLLAAVLRRGVDGGVASPAGEGIDVGAALAAYTSGAALAGLDSSLGRLDPGALADFTIVDRDPFAVPASELATLRTLLTVVGGVPTAGPLAESVRPS